MSTKLTEEEEECALCEHWFPGADNRVSFDHWLASLAVIAFFAALRRKSTWYFGATMFCGSIGMTGATNLVRGATDGCFFSAMEVLVNLHPNNLRYLFYLVTPNETTFADTAAIPNYTDLTMPWLIVLVVLEYFLSDDNKFAFNDTVTSINAGILSIMFKFGGKYLSALVYSYFYTHFRVLDLDPMAASTWVLCFFTQDLAYYLGHRAIHEAGVFWSFHQMHHSSEYYNLSTALRQGAIQDVGMCFFDLLQSSVIPPNIFFVHRHLNVLFQFWLHTEIVPPLGPLEYFLNTPSSHRVHHGRNPYCIDKNYGGTLIIWDRLFGTYEKERKNEKIAYGLVSNVHTFDQLYCQFFEFKQLGYDKPNLVDENGKPIFPTFWDKFKAVFGPPGYFPGVRTKQFFWWRCMVDSKEGIPEIEKRVEVYNPPLTLALRVFLGIHFVVLIFASLHFNHVRASLDYPQFLFGLAFIVSTTQIFGYYFDNRYAALPCDILRHIVVFLVGLHFGNRDWTSCALASLVAITCLAQSRQIYVAIEQKKLE
ncbi:unnamed protein product [Caenorhabditis auriculariae]|uniref:Fatty acid hydroxylase domain-containing protein n=1 Tax=Caenorhabditis auriculariae TaxID=2777116 RepID=A0A8S1HFZ0_9PELO|nr:unnamed protein product [Caenorhabditis auriculariae]